MIRNTFLRLNFRTKTALFPFLPQLSFLNSKKRPIWIQSEKTPNENAIKFIPGVNILPESFKSVEYLNSKQAISSPLAKKLFAIDGVKYVFYGPDYITITKHPENEWSPLKPEIFSIIMEHISSGQPIFLPQKHDLDSNIKTQEDDSEVVSMIKELLETRIRPVIQEDGGDVEYKGYNNGKVLLKLKGACKTCNSSVMTLKNGIENMLMHYIPDVKGVEHVMDIEEEVSIKEFEYFEKTKSS